MGFAHGNYSPLKRCGLETKTWGYVNSTWGQKEMFSSGLLKSSDNQQLIMFCTPFNVHVVHCGPQPEN